MFVNFGMEGGAAVASYMVASYLVTHNQMGQHMGKFGGTYLWDI